MIERRLMLTASLSALALLVGSGASRAADGFVVAQHKAMGEADKDDNDDDDDDDDDDKKEPTPEERMQARFPQPVRVGFLIGLPVLDWRDSTLGFVRDVVRTPEGKINLIVPQGGWFGRGGRPVAVPIETVAILARQIAALEFTREQFDAAPTWTGAAGQAIDPKEMIRIAITRR